MVKHYKNGDKVLQSCIFCGADFEESQKLGSKIECPSEDEGGCEQVYRVSMYSEPNVKDTEKPKEEE